MSDSATRTVNRETTENFSFLLAIALTIGAIAAFTLSVRAGGLEVTQAYAPKSIGAGKAGAVYFTIVNGTESSDRLMSASTAAARKAEVHNHINDAGVMKMRKVDSVEIAAGGHVMFEPGGYHLMLFGLETPLEDGTDIEVTLQFEKAGAVKVVAPVKPLDYKPHGHSHTQ